MHLLVDENLQKPTLAFLRSLGRDVIGVEEAGLSSIDNLVIFEHARQTQRVLLTYDIDFADIRQLVGKHHAGIIRLRISNQRLPYMQPILGATFDCLVDLDLRDTLVTVSDKRIRIRRTFVL